MAGGRKSNTLYVGNLPRDATRNDVEEIFGEIGPIKKCYVLQGRSDCSYAYVTYALPEDADTAVAELVQTQVRGRQLTVSLSARKAKGRDNSTAPATKATPAAAGATTQAKPKLAAAAAPGTVRPKRKRPADAGSAEAPQPKRTPADSAKLTRAVTNKKWRLIVRNLSFKITEESFQKHFSAIGPVVDVSLLRKPSGLLVGCGFVQFKHQQHAEQAITQLNAKPLLGRPVVIDWAVDKGRYESAKQRDRRDSGVADSEGTSSGQQTTSLVQSDVSPVEKSTDSEQSDEVSSGSEEEEHQGEQVSDSSGDDSESDGSTGEEEEQDEGIDIKHRSAEQPGTALFIKNLSFDTDEAALRQLFSRYGQVKYALICVDPLTEHSRGTAFVHFKQPADAETALAAAADPERVGDFTLDTRHIQVLPAMDKQQLQLKKQQLHHDQATEGKDKRNLYLAREGLVREGSRAAEGVSKADLNKRIGLEKWKTKMLKSLTMFVSKTRLCIHNLPADMDDAQLRVLFQSHSPPGAQITEARVMRDRKDTSTHPKGASKEYGFVTFQAHEHALAALRNINNNPDIFRRNRRPIVEFSVENRAALQARQRRLESSKQQRGGARPATTGGQPRRQPPQAQPQPQRPAHAGMASDPSVRSLPKLKQRTGPITRKMLKRGKKVGRCERLGQKLDVVEEQSPVQRQPRKEQKKKSGGVRSEDKNFASLVEKYRLKLTAASSTPKKRWHE